MKCKFCGCDESRGCSIAVRVLEDGSELIETGIIEQLDPTIEYVACAWLLPDVCSAPACVEKAYAEAKPLAEQIDQALRMEDAA